MMMNMLKKFTFLAVSLIASIVISSTIPNAMAGDLLVSGNIDDSVIRYDGQTGTFIDKFVAKGSGGLNGPDGLTFGPDGNLYVSSNVGDNILRYNGQTGAFSDIFASGGGLNGPKGLVFGPDGNLYVSSDFTDNILRYNGQTGVFMDVFAVTGPGVQTQDSPRGLAFGPDGNLYVSSLFTDNVLRYDGQTGAFIDDFVTANSGGLNAPEGLIFGPDGDLYVSSSATDQVLRFNGQTGAFSKVFASGGGLDNPKGLVFGPDGNLYVSSNNTGEILRYDGQIGSFIDVFVPQFSGDLSRPTFLIFSSPASLKIFPPSSTLATSVNFDLALLVNAPGLSIVGGSAKLNGVDITTEVASCVIPGALPPGGLTLRCPGLGGSVFGVGTHTFDITLNFNDGSSVSGSATWEILNNAE